MVGHEISVQGVDLLGLERKRPVILQMNDDDFPARFLQDLASQEQPKISSAVVLNTQPLMLYQPVQRMLNVAIVDLNCDSLCSPRLDPKRIVSAGVVIRRVYRVAGPVSGKVTEEFHTLSGWMRNPKGQYSWTRLSSDQEDCDPNPTQRPQLQSGQANLDLQLASQALSTASAESTTPAFAAPPATCAALGRTVVYAVIPTASSEVSDTQPKSPPLIDRHGLVTSLPALLRSKKYSSGLTVPSTSAIDYRWMSDEFLNDQYPPNVTTSATKPPVSTPSSDFTWFHGFATALRMLHTVFNAFDNQNEGAAILNLLNQHNVSFADGHNEQMGDFYRKAKSKLLDNNSYPSAGQAAASSSNTLTMPTAWDALSHAGEKTLVDALIQALGPASSGMLSPQGRFQDSTRYYKLRMFFRIKSESGTCPPKLVWSQYSHHFQIAPWHATGNRPHPPIPLPDPTSAFIQSAKPNCSFQVPGNLMSAMQGTTLAGLMKGAGGGGGLSLNWICGFNIPLITICAFFVLNIFLSLLNIVFFWLPIIKICIPLPLPSPSAPDDGAP